MGARRLVGRRGFLGGLAVGTAGLATGLRPAVGLPGKLPTLPPIPDSSTALGQGTFQLFSQSDLNFQTLFALGGAGINSAVGEVTTAVAQANAAEGGASYQSLYDAMVATGDRLKKAADDAVKAKHVITARERYLRAAQYYNQALFWVLGTSTPDQEELVYETMDETWRESAKRQTPRWEPFTFRWNRRELPAWFIRPAGASGRRRTVIMNNGSDGQNVDMLPQGATFALQRGWNVVIFEGPGQGRTLFVDKVPFTPDWHEVITPLFDVVQQRSDVDPKGIVLWGVSFGGLLVVRAAAKEHRLKAVVSDPGSVSDYDAFPAVLRDVAKSGDQAAVNAAWESEVIPGSNAMDLFQLKKRLEIYTPGAIDEVREGKVPADWYGISRAIQKFDLGDLGSEVTTPTLVINYELEQFYPGQATELYARLPKKWRDIVTFTKAEGAEYHDAPIGAQWHGEVVMDWLEERVR
jgi:pimeloyl-ACP methyl ester carboxylesterase